MHPSQHIQHLYATVDTAGLLSARPVQLSQANSALSTMQRVAKVLSCSPTATAIDAGLPILGQCTHILQQPLA
jgi:hypothetical protein